MAVIKVLIVSACLAWQPTDLREVGKLIRAAGKLDSTTVVAAIGDDSTCRRLAAAVGHTNRQIFAVRVSQYFGVILADQAGHPVDELTILDRKFRLVRPSSVSRPPSLPKPANER